MHPSFDDRALPDKPVLRALTRAERRLAQRVTRENESALAVTKTFRNLETAAMRGLELPAHIIILEASYERSGVFLPISMVSYSDRLTTGLQRFPSATIMGGRLHLNNLESIGNLSSGWETYDSIRVTYVPLPPQYLSLAEPIHLPELVHEALVYALAYWMAMRVGLVLPGLKEETEAAEAHAVAALSESDAASTWLVRVTHLP